VYWKKKDAESVQAELILALQEDPHEPLANFFWREPAGGDAFSNHRRRLSQDHEVLLDAWKYVKNTHLPA